MAADGEDMTNPDASDFVQEVTPFPQAQDLFLLSKQSLPESVLLQSALSDTNNPKKDEGSIHELVSLAPEHPFQPFLEALINVNGVEVEEGSQRLSTDVDDGNGFVLHSEHSLSEDSNSKSAGLGDVSEKRVGEKIALFEGLAVQLGDDNDEHTLGKIEILDSQDDRQNESRTMLRAELPDVLRIGAVPGNSDGLTVEEERVTADGAVSSGEDVLFEGLTLVDPPSESLAKGTAGLGLDDVSVVRGLEEVIDESGEVKVESVAICGSLIGTSKESEASESSHTDITFTNGTHKVETLGEILSRDRKEKVSREVGRGTGEEASSSQIVSSDHARIASDSMGNTSKTYQGNGDSVPPRALKPAPVANSDG